MFSLTLVSEISLESSACCRRESPVAYWQNAHAVIPQRNPPALVYDAWAVKPAYCAVKETV